MLGGTFINRKICPIGIDIGTQGVKLMQLERAGGGFKAVAAAAADLPGDIAPGKEGYHRAVTEAIVNAKDAGNFTGHAVVSALPADAVKYKNLRLPKMPPGELAAAVRWEAQDRLQLGGEPHAIQFFDAGEVRQGNEERQEIILMAAHEAFIDQHVKALTDCGLAPNAIDVIPGAMARCFEGAGEDTDGNSARVIIDIGYGSSKVLMSLNGQILFFKLIDAGGRQFDEAAARQLNKPRAELAALRAQMRNEDNGLQDHVCRAILEAVRSAVAELGREIGLCLRYYSVTFRGRRPEVAYLTGGEALSPWLPGMLTEQAGVDVKVTNPMPHVDLSGIRSVIPDDSAAIAWVTAAGLSMRANQPAQSRSAKGVAA